jgi:hypothetical protein
MGACCGAMFDANPDTPPFIKPDPEINQPLLAVMAALGYWGMSHDYGIWQNSRPDKDANQEMWMWFRRRDCGSGSIKVNLENFVRTDEKNPKQGKILYYALLQRQPNVQHFQRIAGQSNTGWLGFLGGLLGGGNNNQGGGGQVSQGNDDDYYINHHNHTSGMSSYGSGGRIVGKTFLITKWQSFNSATIYDGDLGRGVKTFGNNSVVLETVAVGTAITTYMKVEEVVQERDGEGNITGSHTHTKEHRHSTTFVDNVQYRVSVGGGLWSQWSIPGDSSPQASMGNSVIISTPFFNTTLEGGWFSRTKFHCQTNNGIDPALALLLSQLLCTEYSIPEIKNDLDLPIPLHAPHPQGMGLLGQPASLGYMLPQLAGAFNAM